MIFFKKSFEQSMSDHLWLYDINSRIDEVLSIGNIGIKKEIDKKKVEILKKFNCQDYESLQRKILDGEIKIEATNNITYHSDSMKILSTKNEYSKYKRMKTLWPLITLMYFIFISLYFSNFWLLIGTLIFPLSQFILVKKNRNETRAFAIIGQICFVLSIYLIWTKQFLLLSFPLAYLINYINLFRFQGYYESIIIMRALEDEKAFFFLLYGKQINIHL